jgi:hypothetical protein
MVAQALSVRKEPDTSGSFLMLFPYFTDILLCISAPGTPSAHKKWITVLCSSLVQMKSGPSQVYDTKLMTGMDFEVHICTTTVGDKYTTRIASCPTSSVTNCTTCTYITNNFCLILLPWKKTKKKERICQSELQLAMKMRLYKLQWTS